LNWGGLYYQIKDKVAVVTEAGSGMGKVIAIVYDQGLK